MKTFKTLTSTCCPLPVKDVDTDMIIPAQYMTSISKEGYGENLFRRLRDSDPSFPLNQSKYQSAKILIADENFGCGSSREHAVWALSSWGIEVIIAKSFADIFFSNSAKSGLLLISLASQKVDRLLSLATKEEGLKLTVDLEKQLLIEEDGGTLSFEYNPFRKHCLLNGLEDLDYIFSKKVEIAGFRRNQEKNRFADTAKVAAGKTTKTVTRSV